MSVPKVERIGLCVHPPFAPPGKGLPIHHRVHVATACRCISCPHKSIYVYIGVNKELKWLRKQIKSNPHINRGADILQYTQNVALLLLWDPFVHQATHFRTMLKHQWLHMALWTTQYCNCSVFGLRQRGKHRALTGKRALWADFDADQVGH